jgi:type I site-specific restriction endonuclease
VQNLVASVNPMTPEEKARQNIDRQLDACGWKVQDKQHVNLSAATGIVRL